MYFNFSLRGISSPICALFLGTVPLVMAAPEVFTIDPAKSTATCSGSINVPIFGNFPVVIQGPGSLTAAYGGTLVVDVTPSTIAFEASGICTAQNSGSWAPLSGGTSGTAPANYGGTVTANTFLGVENADVAVRNAAFNISSTPIPLSGTTFDASSASFSFVAGGGSVMDYLATGPSPNSGSSALTGSSGNGSSPNATLVTSGTTQTLTIPVNITFTTTVISANDTTLHIQGQLVATRSTATVALTPMQISLSGNNITLSWISVVGEKNRIETTDNLKTWATLEASVTSSTTFTTYPTVKNGNVRFFRRALLP